MPHLGKMVEPGFGMTRNKQSHYYGTSTGQESLLHVPRDGEEVIDVRNLLAWSDKSTRRCDRCFGIKDKVYDRTAGAYFWEIELGHSLESEQVEIRGRICGLRARSSV